MTKKKTTKKKAAKKATKAASSASKKKATRKPSTAKPKKKRIGRPPLSPEEKERKRVERNAAERERRAKLREFREEAIRHAHEADAAMRSRPEKSGKPSPPDFVPTIEDRTRVEMLAGFGMTHQQIAMLVTNPRTGLPISKSALQDHFAVELERGGPKANALIAQSLFKKAQGDSNGAVTAAIFYLKCRAGWRETQAIEIEAKSGVLVAPAESSVDEWIEGAQARTKDARDPGEE